MKTRSKQICHSNRLSRKLLNCHFENECINKSRIFFEKKTNYDVAVVASQLLTIDFEAGDYQALSNDIFAETNLPIIPPKPIPGQSETAESPDVSSILGTDFFVIEMGAIHGALLSYYFLSNGRSGKVSHIIVNDSYCGRPRMLFRNAANPEEVTFCYETFGLLKRLSVIFDNKTLGEVNFEKNEKITRNNSSNSEYCWVNLENKEATREIFRIVKNRRHMGRLIFDHQQCQVTIEFISRLDIYWRVLFFRSAMRKAIAFESHKKPVQRVSGLDDVIAIVRRINQ